MILYYKRNIFFKRHIQMIRNSEVKANIYVLTENPGDIAIRCKERKDEIEAVLNEKVKTEKTEVWKLLEIAAEHAYGYKPDEVIYKKLPCGKWIGDKFCFSLSHTFGASAVIVSDKPCGIDIENIDKFCKKCEDANFLPSFLKAIGCEEVKDAESALTVWTRKESVFKTSEQQVFSPKKISAESDKTRSFIFDGFIMSATCDFPCDISFYKVVGGIPKRFHPVRSFS